MRSADLLKPMLEAAWLSKNLESTAVSFAVSNLAPEHLREVRKPKEALIAKTEAIIEKTEGNPFFMEETVPLLFDEGALLRNGSAVQLTRSLNTLKIPPTVRGILAARIDRLPSDAKDLLQMLAVVGREFPLSLIRGLIAKADDELRSCGEQNQKLDLSAPSLALYPPSQGVARFSRCR